MNKTENNRIDSPFARLKRGSYWYLLWENFYTAREILTRKNGRLHSMYLSARTQSLLVFIALSFIGWTAYSVISIPHYRYQAYLAGGKLLEVEAVYQSRVADLQQKQEALEARLELAKDRFSKITKEMEERHDYLISLIIRSDKMEADIEERRAQEQAAHTEITPGKRKKKKAGKQSNILFPFEDSDPVELSARPADYSAGSFRIEELEPVGFSSYRKDFHMTGVLAGTGDEHLDSAIPRLEMMDREQQIVLHHIDEDLQNRLQSHEEAVVLMGVFDIDRLLDRVARAPAEEQAVGGPFVPIDPPSAVRPAVVQEGSGRQRGRVDALMTRLDRISHLLTKLPLMPPVKPYFVTSGYGPRIDPFTQKWALHEGIDLAGKGNDEVYATLDGEITSAGPSINYGNLIEINHGNGVTTRYGHIKGIKVKPGDTVKRGEPIALIGGVGRSTGDHLHYEIMIDGKRYDPWKFFEASKHVFQITEK